MKGIKLIVPLLIATALCGCASVGLGDKMIVKALFLDHQTEYVAQVLVLEPQPSADAGEASETMRLIEGRANTLAGAISNAESARAEELFYGQNELLLLGPGLRQDGMNDCCRFLYENSAGRPNMAVWGIESSAAGQTLTEENTGPVLEGIRRLGEQGAYRTYLYQLAAAQGGGILPLVCLSDEDGVQLKGIDLYQNGKSAARFAGSESELAALFSGQAGTGQFQVEGENGPITLTVRSPKLIYQCLEQAQTLQLSIHLSGHVEQMTGEDLPASRKERRALLEQINRQLEQIGAGVIARSFAPGSDPFGFLNRFFNQNHRLTAALEESGALYRPGIVEFSSALQFL